MKIDGHSVKVADVQAEIYLYGQDLAGYDPAEITEYGCDEAGGDVRLQVLDGWMLHTGDSSYDQDHRGFLGCSWVRAGCTWKEARETARDLIDQAADMAAEAAA